MKNSKTIILSSILIASFSIANVSAKVNHFTLKGEAPTGTMISTIDAKSSIPFNKRYFQLSDSQKNIFRSKFQQISDQQIPPFPHSGLQAIYKPIIAESKRMTAQGLLSATVQVDEAGQVTNFTILQSPNRRLSKATEEILLNTQFDPAFCDGEPCKMEFPVMIKFL